MLTTIYIIFTVVLFSINVLANIGVLATTPKEKFPTSAVLATILSIAFVVWGVIVLVS
jgi:hypothetical protein